MANARADARAQREQSSDAVCRMVVYVEPDQQAWLRKLEADSLLDGRRLGSSAVVRMAIDVLMRQRPDHREIQRRLDR